MSFVLSSIYVYSQPSYTCEGWGFNHSNSQQVSIPLKKSSRDAHLWSGNWKQYSFVVDAFFLKDDQKMSLFIHDNVKHSVSHSVQFFSITSNAFVEQQALYNAEKPNQLTLGLRCFYN